MKRNIKNQVLRETVINTKLKNGLDVYVLPKKGYYKQFAIYATRYGSNDSEFVPVGEKDPVKVPDGIAHFLEHKLFEEEEGNIFEQFSRLGAQPNAFTNYTTTAYYFTSTGNFYECLDTLIKFVGRPYFTDENVEKEKGIITQEIKMYDDNPNWRVFSNLLKGLYHDYPVNKDIAGDIESIKQIDKDILYKCYNTFYHPSNMVLFITGDVENDRIIEQLDRHFKEEKVHKKHEIKRLYPHEPTGVASSKIKDKLPVSRPLFALGFKDPNVGERGSDLMEKIIVSDIILDMLVGPSSDLYNRMYQEGLINDSFQFNFTGERDYGYAIMGGESPHPEKVADIIFEEVEKRNKQPWESEHFLRIKRKKTGEFIKIFNSLESIGVKAISMIFNDIGLFEYLDIIERIDFSSIKQRSNELFDPERSTLSLISPKSFIKTS